MIDNTGNRPQEYIISLRQSGHFGMDPWVEQFSRYPVAHELCFAVHGDSRIEFLEPEQIPDHLNWYTRGKLALVRVHPRRAAAT